MTELKDTKSEVTYDVPNGFKLFNVFEYGRKILYRLDVSYKRAYMAIPKEEYFTEMLDHLNEYNNRHGQRLFSKKIRDAVIVFMKEKE